MRTRKLNAVHQAVTITRSPEGIPQLVAQTWEDAFFGLGWLHARDRGGQMALTRIVGQGRLCELVKDDAALLELDIYFRRLGLARDARTHINKLAEPYSDYLSAYTRGVNAAWAKQKPGIFRLLGLLPEPFDPDDSLMLVKLISYTGLAEGQRIAELFVMHAVRQGVDAERLQELLPTLDSLDVDAIQNLAELPPLFPNARVATGMPVSGGSNAWVVSGKRSHSNAPILCNDPHLEVNRLPAVVYEASLVVADEWVKGATIPGMPGFIVGRTPNIAWGVTYSCADTSDFFIERCKDGCYLRDNEWKLFQQYQENILRKRNDPHKITFYVNEHGVLEGDPTRAGDYLCWKWTGYGDAGLEAFQAFTDLIHCKTAKEAQTAARQMDIPPLHMVFADRNNNIAYQFTGRVPRRKPGWSGLAPATGWDRAKDWQGWRDPDTELPSEINPKHGHIVITNEERQCKDGPRLSSIWLSRYRRERIEQVLLESEKHTPQDMQALQYSVLSLQARSFLPEYLRFISDEETRSVLESWDFQYDNDSVAAALFENIHRAVIVEVFGSKAMSREMVNYLIEETSLYSTLVGFFDDVMIKPDSKWLPAARRDEVIARGVQRGLRPKRQRWGDSNALVFRNIFLGDRVPGFLGFNRTTTGLQGNCATVHQGTMFRVGGRLTSFAPCYHFVTDLATNEAWTNFPGGVSESRFSRWYTSDIERWLKGVYKRL